MSGTNTQQPVQVLNPSSINLPELLKSKGLTDKQIKTDQDRYAYLLHRIIVGNTQYDFERGEYVHLKMKYLERMLTAEKAGPIVKNSVTWGIIERTTGYKSGVRSIGYKIHSAYQSQARWVPLVGKTVARRLRQHQEERKAQALQACSVAGKYEKANLHQLTIDREGAEAYNQEKWEVGQDCLSYYRESLQEVKSAKALKEWKKEREGEGKKRYPLMFSALVKSATQARGKQWKRLADYVAESFIHRHDMALWHIEQIATGEFFFERPDPDSRIYTNVSSLPTDFRRFLSCKGSNQKLTNLDIKNSQPYLFGLLLRAKYEGQEFPADVQHYMKLTATGEFYEFMMGQLGLLEGEEARAEFKTTFFAQLFFCKAHHSRRTREGKVFREVFPQVFALIESLKVEGQQMGKRENGKDWETSLLPLKMQRREAHVIHEVIGLQLAQRGLWFATIHDSIVVEQSQQHLVTEIILQAFLKEVGISPSIKVDLWD